MATDDMRVLGQPNTVGELRRLLAPFPDDTRVCHHYVHYVGGVRTPEGIEGEEPYGDCISSLEVAAMEGSASHLPPTVAVVMCEAPEPPEDDEGEDDEGEDEWRS